MGSSGIKAKHTAKFTQQASRAALLDGECLRATSKELHQGAPMNRERALTWKKMRAQQTRRKKARMRTALEVIRRLEWDPACCAAAVVVGYRDLDEVVERPL